MTIEITGTSWGCDANGGYIMLRTASPQIAVQAVERLHPDKQYIAEIKLKKNKRSLDANAYAWVLLGKLSATLNVPPEEIYRRLIRDVGGNYDVVCVQDKACAALRAGWEHNGIGWITDTMPSKISGCTTVLLYYGSSQYDSAQMARLIDLIIQECAAQEIETLPPAEIERLNNDWRNKIAK